MLLEQRIPDSHLSLIGSLSINGVGGLLLWAFTFETFRHCKPAMNLFLLCHKSGNHVYCLSFGIIACHKISSDISSHEQSLVWNETYYLTSALACRLILRRAGGGCSGERKVELRVGNLANWLKILNNTGEKTSDCKAGKLKRWRWWWWEYCRKTLPPVVVDWKWQWKKFDKVLDCCLSWLQ